MHVWDIFIFLVTLSVLTSMYVACPLTTLMAQCTLGHKNFSEKWISGADSVRMTNIHDHAKSNQHVHAMNLRRKELVDAKGLDTSSYSSIAQTPAVLPELH